MKAIFADDAYWRRYSQAEAQEKFLPIVRPLVVPDESDAGFLDLPPTSGEIFARRDWVGVAFDGLPCGASAGVPNSSGRTDVHQYSPETGRWHPLNPLWHAVIEDEVDEVILMHCPYTALHGATATIPLPRGPGPVEYEPYGTFMDGVVFSRKANWLLVATTDDVSVLAGEPAFMEKVIEFGGGLDFLKQQFEELWDGLEHDRDPWAHNAAYCAYLAAGWEAPDYIRRDVTPPPPR